MAIVNLNQPVTEEDCRWVVLDRILNPFVDVSIYADGDVVVQKSDGESIIFTLAEIELIASQTRAFMRGQK